MGNNASLSLLFPPGRFIEGDLYEPNNTTMDGKPLLIKNGPNAGQPRVEYVILVAIPKTQAGHWAHEVSTDASVGAWGSKLWNFIHSQWPNGETNRRDFAYKVIDGDSTEVNQKNVRWCDKPNFAGNWIVVAKSGFQPKLVNRDGSVVLTEPGAIKRGYFVQLFADIESNRSQQTPGIYINSKAVALSAYGEEIAGSVDTTSLGFGGGALPAGASSTPLGGMTTAAAGAVAATGAPPPPGASAAPPPPGAPPSVSASSAPVATPPPAAGFTAGAVGAAPPPPPGAGAPPPPPAAGPVFEMTGSGGAFTREQMHAAGWNDDALINAGHMRRVA